MLPMCHRHIWLNAAALTRLRREKTDVHAASFFRLHFYSGILPELCEAKARLHWNRA